MDAKLLSMVIAYFPLVIALIGLLMYYFAAASSKTVEVGRLMFSCGLLVTLFTMASKVIRLT